MTGIYLDSAATMPIDPRVFAAMEPYLLAHYGNPHAENAHAVEPATAVADAAFNVANLIKADPGEIVFTSGATEANNAALKGVMQSASRRGSHLIVSAIEHSCVLEAARSLERQGARLTIVPVSADGVVDPDEVMGAVRDDTALVSIMLVNNEIGTIQPMNEVAVRLRGTGVALHTDAAQAPARIVVDIEALQVDLLSLSGHKLGGPKGVGALFISKNCPTPLEPLLHGGGQQGGRRGGTVPTFLAVGLGEAARLAPEKRRAIAANALRFERALRARYPHTVINGGPPRAGGILSARLPFAEAQSVLQLLHGKVSASLGSACHAGSINPSHVLTALGLREAEMAESIRFSFHADQTEDDLIEAAGLIADAAHTVAEWARSGVAFAD